MAVLVPVVESIIQGLGQLILGLETASFQRQRTKLLLPWLNQVQSTSILWDELQLHFRPSGQSHFHRSAGVDGQVILNDQPAIGWECGHNLIDQLNVAGAVAPGVSRVTACPVAGSNPPSTHNLL